MDPSSASVEPATPIDPAAWKSIDRLYCITLSQRPDRRAAAEREFQRVGLAGIVEFVVVPRHPTDSEQGIFESHLRCLRQGIEAGANSIAVFEDDVIFPHFSPATLAHVAAFLRSGTPWDAFFLGCFVSASRKTPYPSVIRIRFKTTAHAYIVSRPFALKLLAQPWNQIPFDDLIRTLATEHFYAAYPALAFQSAASTDNRNILGIDRVRRLLGGLRRLQKLNEFTHRHLAAIVAAHVIILCAALVLILLFALR